MRGAFGHSLHDNYPYIYDTVLKIGEQGSTPTPLVISVPYPSKGEYKAGEALTFYITLLGTACVYEAEIIDAAKYMCKGKFDHAQLVDYQQVYSHHWSDEGAAHIPHCDTLTVNFLTPAEIFVQGKTTTQLDFALFIDRLFGRISGIIDSFGESEFVLPYHLIVNKPYVTARYDLRTVKFQTNNQPVIGIYGSVQYFGDVTRYLPYVDLGSQIHIGKKTSRACGEYCFEIGI